MINNLSKFKSVSLIESKSGSGNRNLSIFSSIFYIGANPVLIALIFIPSPLERDTLSNILESGFYALNHINESIYKKAHQTSARYDAAVSEFDAVGSTTKFKNEFQAPFVKV